LGGLGKKKASYIKLHPSEKGRGALPPWGRGEGRTGSIKGQGTRLPGLWRNQWLCFKEKVPVIFMDSMQEKEGGKGRVALKKKGRGGNM